MRYEGVQLIPVNRTIGSAPIHCVRADLTKSPPRSGVLQISFDSEATLFLVRLETQPHVVHIHTFLPTSTSPSPDISHLAALVLTEPVRSARWCPGRRKLAISTRSGAAYFWDGDGGWIEDGDESAELRGGTMEGVGVPARAWSLQRVSLSLTCRNAICRFGCNMVARRKLSYHHGPDQFAILRVI